MNDPLKNLMNTQLKLRKKLKLPDALIDNQRIYPVDHLIIHHSAGNPSINQKDIELQDAFDSVGLTRGYKPANRTHSLHSHPQRDKETFAMAHFALHKYDLDENPYGWRLVPLMSNWWQVVAWHAGSWEINQRSIGIEICGDYTNTPVDENALQLIADYFRPHYARLRELYLNMKVFGHRDVSMGSTSCPGKIIDQIPKLRDLLFEDNKLIG